MKTIQTITPILARTVVVVSILTTLMSVVTVLAVGEKSILMFTGFSIFAGLYARKVLREEPATGVEAEQTLARIAA